MTTTHLPRSLPVGLVIPSHLSHLLRPSHPWRRPGLSRQRLPAIRWVQQGQHLLEVQARLGCLECPESLEGLSLRSRPPHPWLRLGLAAPSLLLRLLHLLLLYPPSGLEEFR